jgi:hypothetical protein
MSPHCNIHKYIYTSPDRNSHNLTDHILLERQRHSSVFDVRSFRAADCDVDHYLVVAALEDLNAEVEMNRAWEMIRI